MINGFICYVEYFVPIYKSCILFVRYNRPISIELYRCDLAIRTTGKTVAPLGGYGGGKISRWMLVQFQSSIESWSTEAGDLEKFSRLCRHHNSKYRRRTFSATPRSFGTTFFMPGSFTTSFFSSCVKNQNMNFSYRLEQMKVSITITVSLCGHCKPLFSEQRPNMATLVTTLKILLPRVVVRSKPSRTGSWRSLTDWKESTDWKF